MATKKANSKLSDLAAGRMSKDTLRKVGANYVKGRYDATTVMHLLRYAYFLRRSIFVYRLAVGIFVLDLLIRIVT